MSEDKELSVDTSLKEELDIKKKKLEDLMLILQNFSKILDYNELDVARFLNTRKSQKYYLLTSSKILCYSIFYFFMFSNVISISISSLSLRIFSGILLTTISYCFLRIGVHFDNLSFKKFGFTHSYYHKEKKDMKNLRNQIILLFKNKHLWDFLGKEVYDELYKHRLQNLEERVESYSKLIQPYFYRIKQYGLFGTFFSLIIGFLLNLIVQYFWIQPAMEVILSEIILFPSVYILALILFYFQIKSLKNKSIYKAKKLLVVIKKHLTILIYQHISDLFEKEFKDDEIKIRENLNKKKNELNEKIREEKEKRDELIKKNKDIKKNIKESKDKIDNNKSNKLQEELTSMKKELDNHEKQIKDLKKNLKDLKKF